MFKMGEKEPMDPGVSMANAHSIALHPDTARFVVSATNPNSSGNGKPKGDEYPINSSPVLFFVFPGKEKPKDKKGNDLLVPSLGL